MRSGFLGHTITFLFTLMAWLALVGATEARTIPAWQAETLKSIVRIVSQKCVGPCQDPDQDRWVRRGSGFVTTLSNFDRPVIVTALHVVAGANKITYQFTEVDKTTIDGKVIAVDRYNDVAILALGDNSNPQPLQLSTTLPQDNQVIVYGYKEGSLEIISDEGRIKLKGPTTLRKAPIGDTARNAIARLRYPDLDMTIVALEEAINPGDSGAPVFDIDGDVVGMAEGGLPSSATQLTWMVPSQSLLNVRKTASDVADFDASSYTDFFHAFYTFSERQSSTRIGLHPAVKFTLGWRADFEPLSGYGGRISENYETLIGLPPGPFGSVIIERESDFFPRLDEDIYRLVTSASLEVTCYRAAVFEKILLSESPYLPQSDFYMSIPMPEFTNAEGGVTLSYTWKGPAPGLVLLSSNGLVSYRPGYGQYTRHPDIHNVEDLYGGACKLSITGNRYSPTDDQTRRLSKELRFGAMCLDIFFTDQSYTPVSFTSFLPLGKELSDGQIWGYIPDFETDGTVDQQSCM